MNAEGGNKQKMKEKRNNISTKVNNKQIMSKGGRRKKKLEKNKENKTQNKKFSERTF